MNDLLQEYRKWLLDDQWDFGEFGKHEVTNPTDMPRRFELSLIKPNIFSSITAFNSLIATGDVTSENANIFYEWINRIRSENKYWTSASGVSVPFGQLGGWARSNNLRHTAKCLDQYMLHGCFSYSDASVFHEIIDMQLDNGAFPQFIGSEEDIWSTAYFSNLLIRASMKSNLRLTLPSRSNETNWNNVLTTKLDRAIDWLLSQLNSNSLWELPNVDSVVITTAMLTEIGGYLALHRKSHCAAIISSLLQMGISDGTFLYVALLAIDSLPPDAQRQIIECYDRNRILEIYRIPKDLVEASCLCKLAFFQKELGQILFYRDACNGHESLLCSEESWKQGDYFEWAINQVYDNKHQLTSLYAPIQDMDFWGFVNNSIERIKHSIEFVRGWEFLWNGDIPVKEERVQVLFDNQLKTLCETNGVSVFREIETGRGPVDFTFFNHYSSKCLLEIKLATNSTLKSGNALAQIYEYAAGITIKSAFLAIIGFCDEDKDVMENVNAEIIAFRKEHSDFFVQSVFIDASKKVGASKSKLKKTQ